MFKFETKKTIYTLTSTKGIGSNKSKIICNLAGIGKFYKYNELSNQQKNLIDKIIKNNLNLTVMPVDLIEKSNINKLKEIKSYRGDRHYKLLPVRGQRTHSNSSTQKKKLFKK